MQNVFGRISDTLKERLAKVVQKEKVRTGSYSINRFLIEAIELHIKRVNKRKSYIEPEFIEYENL